mmetsp:Transcript_25464/g.55362  ORF Transcript_25464/g.55362 Transcript_25464/m.55362 type:complete len:153 (+) Transcript_25464:90-548(+)
MTSTPDPQACLYGLEIKEKWVHLLRSGAKTVELRAYPLPDHLLGVDIAIIEGPNGQDMVSALPDRLGKGHTHSSIVAVVRFDEVRTYSSAEECYADASYHCVGPDSAYGWKEGHVALYGWHIASCSWLPVAPENPAMQRTLSSIFKLDWQDP